ncbi:hypothetical protein D1614_19320 [Maribellus luteus]|uniref:DUF4397 domain-containing protein n=1 Tax=Maribellus luteus TaxID=2305463 RepID=A0A399SUS8_9BACT|nr:hypothetical protein [Maribellus luteus]RIJ46352.1 hypothetical protein D1614_19320 [Maribellus luteus]
MKIIKNISLILMVIMTISCDKHEIEYATKSIDGLAEFQLHYFVPVTATSSNNIYRVEINGSLFANSDAPLTTYNAVPKGSVGRFYTVEPGEVNIKLYKGTSEELVYDRTTTLTVGKQNVFIYGFDEDPIVFNNGYPYVANITEDTDSTTYVKFYNFLFETDGVPTDLKLQYQYIDPTTDELVNIGEPVAFGETTGWQPVKLIKDVYNSSGSTRVYYRIKVVDNNGNIVEDLQLYNSSSKYVSYSDYWTGYIGRRVHHVMAGFRSAQPRASVRLFYAL